MYSVDSEFDHKIQSQLPPRTDEDWRQLFDVETLPTELKTSWGLAIEADERGGGTISVNDRLFRDGSRDLVVSLKRLYVAGACPGLEVPSEYLSEGILASDDVLRRVVKQFSAALSFDPRTKGRVNVHERTIGTTLVDFYSMDQ